MENVKPHINRFLFITTFFSGMVTMAVEFGASRLLGNVFGTSNIVWASIIGLIMIYLTVGYWLGGKLSDRFSEEKVLYFILVISGLLISIIPLISRPILRLSADAFDTLQLPILFGSFTAVLILFSIPVTLLGAVSPFALKLALVDINMTGRIAGKMSALSTLGSFIGTFLTVLVTIPMIGTYRTFILFSFLITLIGLIGIWRVIGWKGVFPLFWIPLLIILIGILGIKGTDKQTTGLIHEDESAYNYIQVVEMNEYRYLRLNEGQGVHSIYHPREIFYGGPWSQVLVAPFFNDTPEPLDKKLNVAIIGLAAGTSSRQLLQVYPNANIDGFEIDPVIINVGYQLFGMKDARLNTIAQDGRWGIAHSNKLYNIISVDAYRPPYIPAHMTTREFFKILSDHLSYDGMIVINVGRSPFDRVLINDLSTTILQEFSQVFVTDIPDSFNSIIFASKSMDSGWSAFINNYKIIAHDTSNELIFQAMTLTINGRSEPPEIGRVFTDDLSPIEWLTNKIILDYVFIEEVESIE